MFNDPNVTRIGNTIDIYIEPDQKKWTYEERSAVNNGDVFNFESKYKKIATTQNLGNSYALHRIPYTGWRDKKGGGIGSGECFYTWDDCYWATAIGIKSRVAARFGCVAHYGNSSPRSLYAHYTASNTYRHHCGLAQLLLDVSQPQA